MLESIKNLFGSSRMVKQLNEKIWKVEDLHSKQTYEFLTLKKTYNDLKKKEQEYKDQIIALKKSHDSMKTSLIGKIESLNAQLKKKNTLNDLVKAREKLAEACGNTEPVITVKTTSLNELTPGTRKITSI